MRYLVDTNIWIFYLKHSSSPVVARLRNTPASEVAVCSVVWAELLHGARKYEKRDVRIGRIEQTLAPFRSLLFARSRSTTPQPATMQRFAMNWKRRAR